MSNRLRTRRKNVIIIHLEDDWPVAARLINRKILKHESYIGKKNIYTHTYINYILSTRRKKNIRTLTYLSID